MTVGMEISHLAVLSKTVAVPPLGQVRMFPDAQGGAGRGLSVLAELCGEARLTCSLWVSSVLVDRAVHTGTALSCLNGSSTHRAGAPGLRKDCWELTSSI